MFSSFPAFPNPFGLPRFLRGGSGAIDIKSVEIHDIDTGREKATRTLKHLIKLNHAKHAILFHNMQFHNHAPHILGSAYLLKGSPAHLENIFEEEASTLAPWQDSPGEVSTHDWRDYLGKREYQRAYVDFFEDQFVLHGYDWKKVVEKFLFEGKEPLFNCMIGGLGHVMIHLGYAYELSSREIASEALAMATTQYSFLHKYLDDPKYTKPSSYSTTSPLDILHRVHDDKRFDKDADSITAVFENHEAAILEHWNAWRLPDPKKQFEESQHTATALLVATHSIPGSGESGPKKDYNFFVVHLLTTSHAARIILPLIPAKWHVPLLRQWWLITLAVYIAQGRPKIDLSRITDFDINTSDDYAKDWPTVDRHAIESKWSLDAHYVKALRAMKVAAQTWGDPQDYYLKAAVRFDREFDGWGFGAAGEEEEEQHTRGQGRGGRRGSASGL